MHYTYPSTGTPKLKLKITKEDKKLSVQVLEQDERYIRRVLFTLPLCFLARNGFKVSSELQPELMDDTVYLRGSNVAKYIANVSKYFDSNRSRDAYLSRMEEALREWAENAPEFKTPTKCTCTCCCTDGPCGQQIPSEYIFTV